MVIELDKVEWVVGWGSNFDLVRWGSNFDLAETQFLVEVTWRLGVSV